MRYFFIIQTLNQKVGDEVGAVLSNDDTALARAKKIISQLRDGGECDGWSLTVTDEIGRVVADIPF